MSVGRQRNYDDETKARVLSLYRSLGRNAYRAAKLSGVPRTTLHRWIDALGADYGTLPASVDRVERLSDAFGAGDVGEGATITAEEPSSVLSALVKLDRVRHAYLDRLSSPEVVGRASARDASAVVRDVQAQIQRAQQAVRGSQTKAPA